jgi:hypothetical protein
MPRAINRFLLPVLRTAQFIFALESLVAILVYVCYLSKGTSGTSVNSQTSTGPPYYLFSSVATVAILLGYLILALCVKKRWIKQHFTQCRRRLISIGCTSILTAQWTVAIFVMVPVAIDASFSYTLNNGTETEKLQSLIVKYASIAAVAISCMITLLMIISLVLLIITATEKELFDIDSIDSEDIILDWLDATAHYSVKTDGILDSPCVEDKMETEARRETV